MLPTRRALATASLRGSIRTPQPFSTASALRIKESTSQTDTDYDKHKQDSLRKQQRGEGHWKSELASDSEEAVRADRQGDAVDPKTLQERTKRAAEETAREGTSTKDHMSN